MTSNGADGVVLAAPKPFARSLRALISSDAVRYSVVHACYTGLSFLSIFAQVYVFIRVFGAAEYANLVLIAVAATYLQFIDNAVSKVAFLPLRNAFLSGGDRGLEDAVSGAYALYSIVMLALVIGFSAALTVADRSFTSDDLLRVLFLLLCLLNNFLVIPTQTLAWAVDGYITFDILEIGRRLFTILLLALLFVTHDAFLYVVPANVASLVVLFLVIRMLRARSRLFHGRLLAHASDRLTPELRELARRLPSGLGASLGDFVLYSLPYILIPGLYGRGDPVIIFDTCQKLMRAGLWIARIFSEALLPKQSAAFHRGDRQAVLQALGLMFLAGGVPAVLMAVLLGVSGSWVFEVLLGSSLVPNAANAIVICLIVLSLTYNIASSFLQFSGFLRDTFRVAIVAAISLGGVALVASTAGLGLIAFMWGHGVVFALATALTTAIASRRLLQMTSRS